MTVSLEGVVAVVVALVSATYLFARRHPDIFSNLYAGMSVAMLMVSTFMLGWDARGALGASYQLNSWPVLACSIMGAGWMTFLAMNLRRLSEKSSERHDDDRDNLG